ncbi:MAG: HU family DNA-binding protein [Ectothiorhodospiraceae bacterium]|nr:HU family DNA-binding protein [Chromatiales bacterium]MCP5156377.1 HU family DNA-binding protein [Ectothiorhodospiraceae bacterium]
MNKSELIAAVAADTGMSNAQVEVLLNRVLKAVTGALAKGDDVAIAGFGTFAVKERAARQGRNPRTGEVIQIPASKAPGFKAAKALRDAVG